MATIPNDLLRADGDMSPDDTHSRTLRGIEYRNSIRLEIWEKMAGVTGLEPATSGVTGQRSNQLSYTPSPRG